MRLGIDLGTTRTLVAASDRGNYPLLSFTGPEGDVHEHVPTMSAEVDGRLVHGLLAEQAALGGAPHLRSWKRLLGRHGPDHRVSIGAVTCSLLELATGFLEALRGSIRFASNAPHRDGDEAIEVVVSVPANAHSGQRWATLEAYRRAGFDVCRMLNEPSAAGIEFAHRHANAINRRREQVAVYDLGGGTFDAALVTLSGGRHDVVATAGAHELGGDDFDLALAELALERLRLALADVADVMPAVLGACRLAKEAIGPSTRKITLDLEVLGPRAPEAPLVVPVAEYFARVTPLVERTIDALARVLGAESRATLDLENAATEAGLAGLYVVGGASALPIVARELRERFGRRVHRSPHPAGAIAIGLAIAADVAQAEVVGERLTRHLGVFREARAGERKVFDPIFASGTPMPEPGAPPLVVTRTYRAAHNVGQLRFVECADLDADAEPQGDITPHATIVFPYTPAARGMTVEAASVERLDGPGRWIAERYEVDPAGVIAVTISDLEDGFARMYTL